MSAVYIYYLYNICTVLQLYSMLNSKMLYKLCNVTIRSHFYKKKKYYFLNVPELISDYC